MIHRASSQENEKIYISHLVQSEAFQNQQNPPLFPQKCLHEQGTEASLEASRAGPNRTRGTNLSFPLHNLFLINANYVHVISNVSCDGIYPVMRNGAGPTVTAGEEGSGGVSVVCSYAGGCLPFLGGETASVPLGAEQSPSDRPILRHCHFHHCRKGDSL